jgi:hypothetical protein
MEAKHTPGPWTVEKQPSYSPHRIYVNGANGHQITFFQERKKGSHRGEEATWLGFMPGDVEDAYLIAAAPELLEALEHMVAVSNWATTIQSEEQYDAMIANAEAAIRKAKGE